MHASDMVAPCPLHKDLLQHPLEPVSYAGSFLLSLHKFVGLRLESVHVLLVDLLQELIFVGPLHPCKVVALM